MITVHAQKVIAPINEIHYFSNRCLRWRDARRSREHNLASTELLAQLLAPLAGMWNIGRDPVFLSGRTAPRGRKNAKKCNKDSIAAIWGFMEQHSIFRAT